MRIGLVCPYDFGAPGGVQDQVARLARWLGEGGHDVRIIAPGKSDQPGFVSAGPVTVVPANGAATPIALSQRAGRSVLEALASVDVAHIHEPLMPQVSLTALRRAQVPTVGTFHADVSKPAGLVYTIGRPVVARWLARLDVMTAVSAVAERVVAKTGRVRIIPNGIDIEDYRSDGKEPDTVAFLGRDDARKGLHVLLAAWPKVRAARPDSQLRVIGAEASGPVPPGVTFLGRVSEAEKRRHLQTSAVFCAPNLGGESFGIVLVEAMAASCAIVASGLPAFVRVAGDTARYVSPGDAAGIAAEIIALLSDDGAAHRMGEAAADASRRFGRHEVCPAYEAAYADAIGQHRSYDS